MTPEQLEKAGGPLAHDRQRDQRHRHVAGGRARQDGRPEELDDGRLGRRDVLWTSAFVGAATTAGGMLGASAAPLLSGVAVWPSSAIFSTMIRLTLALEARGRERRVVLVSRVGHVDADLDRPTACRPGSCCSTSLGATRTTSTWRSSRRCCGGCLVGGRVGDLEARAGDVACRRRRSSAGRSPVGTTMTVLSGRR